MPLIGPEFAVKTVLKQIVKGFINQRRQEGLLEGVKRLGYAARALPFLHQHRELFALTLYRRFLVERGGINGLVHFSLPHYLSSEFSLRQRADAALLHYRYESDRHNAEYHRAVYCTRGIGRGITLWATCVDDVEYTIRLHASNCDYGRCEGALAVSLFVGSICITNIRYSWVDSRVFGVNLGVIPFVTCNQSVDRQSADLQFFRNAFPQNAPSYFCFAALRGIAEAHGVTGIAAIRSDCQFSFRDSLSPGFRNSYCEFWESLGGVELDHQAFLIPVALVAPPFAALKSNHRGRAHRRRRNWLEISKSALESVSRHRIELLDYAQVRLGIEAPTQLPAEAGPAVRVSDGSAVGPALCID